MPTRAASTADDIAESIKSLIERVADAKLTQEMARRSQEMAEAIAERGAEVGDRASEAWRETRPVRRDAAKRFARASKDTARWSDQTWKRSVRPTLKDLWSRRTVALGAAGAAVPAGRELVDTAAVRLGLKEREERHWGAFFLGLVLGAIGGAVAALLLAPKRGSEMRQELATRADEMVTRAKDAEWVPMFQRDEATNGQSTEAIADVTPATYEASADAGTATGERAEIAAEEAADAINESFDTVDRDSTS